MPKPRDLPAEGHTNGTPRGTTPTYGLPYPADTDPADVPQDLRELADRLEIVLPTIAAPSAELALGTYTAGVVAVTALTEATAQQVVAAPAVTMNGTTAIVLDFYAQSLLPPAAAGADLSLWLYDGAASIGRVAYVANPAGGTMSVPGRVMRRLTPTAGSHTYSVRASISPSGSGTIGGGTGGAGLNAPILLRITRA